MCVMKQYENRERCTLCSGTSYILKQAGGYIRATQCDCRKACVCGGNGYLLQEDGTFMECGCDRSKEIELVNNAFLPAKYSKANLQASFVKNRKILLECYRFLSELKAAKIDNDFSSLRGLVFYGAVGVGKTHLMVSIALEVIRLLKLETIYLDLFQYFCSAKEQIQQSTASTFALEHQRQSKLITPTHLGGIPVLLLDELGRGRGSEFDKTLFMELISRRYNVSLPIIACTNLPLKQLEEHVGDSTFSRLYEMCKFIEIEGEDLRKRV